jgi:inorganic pyrophosphatase
MALLYSAGRLLYSRRVTFPKPFYRWRPHPWHGLETGQRPPELVNAYIEITPFDLMKYEVDKTTGYLRVDRPQRTSSQPPTLYGFIPRTYCGRHVAEFCPKAERGDGDPLDICVVSERPINRAEVILEARVVGGLQMIDAGEADDKIVAVLANDRFFADVNDIGSLPDEIVGRLRHYFGTYKLVPGEAPSFSLEGVYAHQHACAVIDAAMRDYEEQFGQ